MPNLKGAYGIYNGLIPEMRKKGYSLQVIGDTCGGISRERVRQIINKFYPGTRPLSLRENQANIILGFRLEYLRRKNLITPTAIRNRVRYYDRDTLEKAMLAYYSRSCSMCGKAIPFRRTYCQECSQIRQRYNYPFKTPEQKKQHSVCCRRWQKANPERFREIQKKATQAYRQRHREQYFPTTTYIVVKQNKVLPIGTKFQAVGGLPHFLLLADGTKISCSYIKIFKNSTGVPNAT